MSNFMLPAPLTDATLTQEGCPADAKVVGDKLAEKQKKIRVLKKDFTGTTNAYSEVWVPIPEGAIAILYVRSGDYLFVPQTDNESAINYRCFAGLNNLKLIGAESRTVRGTIIYLA